MIGEGQGAMKLSSTREAPTPKSKATASQAFLSGCGPGLGAQERLRSEGPVYIAIAQEAQSAPKELPAIEGFRGLIHTRTVKDYKNLHI